jgi:flagellar motor switch protein FliN
MPDLQASLWLAEELARQLARALESMTGESPSITYAARELTPDEIDPAKEDFFWWEQPFSLSPHALVWVGASAPAWEGIGTQILKSAGVEDEDRDSIRSTYLEILNQALAGVAGAVSTRVHQEVSCTQGHSAPPPEPEAGKARSLAIPLGEQALSLVVVFSGALADVSDAAAPSPSAKASTSATAISPALAGQHSGSIDLLLDVELPVSVSFGRAQLPLKDVIKLTTGSIVELNRALSEPVEVIVNNCVIARGEVVVVEGNYGIRIKQVVSPQERLRTLN